MKKFREIEVNLDSEKVKFLGLGDVSFFGKIISISRDPYPTREDLFICRQKCYYVKIAGGRNREPFYYVFDNPNHWEVGELIIKSGLVGDSFEGDWPCTTKQGLLVLLSKICEDLVITGNREGWEIPHIETTSLDVNLIDEINTDLKFD